MSYNQKHPRALHTFICNLQTNQKFGVKCFRLHASLRVSNVFAHLFLAVPVWLHCHDKDSACTLPQRFQLRETASPGMWSSSTVQMMRLAAFNYRRMVPELLYQWTRASPKVVWRAYSEIHTQTYSAYGQTFSQCTLCTRFLIIIKQIMSIYNICQANINQIINSIHVCYTIVTFIM